MLKIPRVTNNPKVNFIEQAFQPSTPEAISTPPIYGVKGEIHI